MKTRNSKKRARGLDNFIQEKIADVATPEQFYPYMVMRRLKSIGFKPVSSDYARIRKKITETLRQGHFSLPVSDRRLKALGRSTAEISALLEEPPTEEELQTFEEAVLESVNHAIYKTIQALAAAHGRYLEEVGAEILQEHAEVRQDFLAHHMSTWGDALTGYAIFVEIAREIGTAAYPRIVDELSVKNHAPHKLEATTSLYARSCHIASEVQVLLENGFADGAQARWRSLHEIQVILHILSEGDDDLSKRYLLHHDIDLYSEARLSRQINGKRPTDKQLSRLQNNRDDLVAVFGKDFDQPYGWASAILGFRASRFSDLEAYAGAAFQRQRYKAASANVHGSARGTLNRLGLPPKAIGYLAGASNIGLAQPALYAVHSKILCAVSIATVSGSPEVMAKAMAFQKLGFTLIDKFQSASRSLLKQMRLPSGRNNKKSKRKKS